MKPRWIFISLGVLFILPIIAAHLAYKYGRGYFLSHGTHYGVLLEPPVDVDQFWIENVGGKEKNVSLKRGAWLLFYINLMPDCENACKKRLFFMRQIKLALGKDQNRLTNWYFTLSEYNHLKPDPDITWLQSLGVHHGKISLRMLKSFFGQAPYDSNSGFYLVDPHGNLMMAYPQGENPDHILKDLKRLLRASRIG